jgi:hypothetical protein
MIKSYYPKLVAAKHIDLVPDSLVGTDTAKKLLLFSLQGITARSAARIYYNETNASADYFKHVRRLVGRGYMHAEVEDFWSLFDKYKSEINGSGYILVDCGKGVEGINAATTAAGAEKWLIADISLESRLISLGYEKKLDTVKTPLSQEEAFEKYKDKLNKSILIHQKPEIADLRDYAVAVKAFSFYTHETEADTEFRKKVFAWADDDIPVLGWNDDELRFIESASLYGKFTVPADWANNLSYLSGAECSAAVQKKSDKEIIPDRKKHYAAFVVSDGDNIQWLLRNFSRASLFGQRLRNSLPYKISWTVSPSLSELAPSVMQGLYDDGGEYDSFIAGVSGAGYINPLRYPNLDGFAEGTAALMKKSDLRVVTLLDDNGINGDGLAAEKLANYSRHAEIDGGIWELDPDRYGDGKGKIFWSADKPFMSVRLSLWHPSNRMGAVTKAWLRAQAQKVNSAVRNPYQIDGYTVINVHPWTMTMKDIDYFVSRLAPDVTIISAPEMIAMAKAILPHKNESPLKTY